VDHPAQETAPSGQLALWGAEADSLRINIRESRRSRRLCVRVDRDAVVEVVVPRGTPRRHVASVLAQHEAWIARRVATAVARPVEPFPPPLVTLVSGVAPGDRVVTAGVHSLRDGQTVKIDQGELR
jgi:multidrug efflux pump subunit AcrA (membrane-fusion protein)